MKTKYHTLILIIGFFLLALSTSCDKNNNSGAGLIDTLYVVDTTKYEILNKLSAVWQLESGYSEKFYSQDTEFRWLDDDCEDAVDGLLNPLPQEFEDQTVLSRSFNYADALATYNQLLATTEDDPYDTLVGYHIPKNEYEDAHSKSNVNINFNYELIIKKTGEYKIYITYNYYEDNYPLYPDDALETQYGKTFSGTFEYVDNWYFIDNSIGSNPGLLFEGFPLPMVDIIPVYDLTDIQDIQFLFNYVSGIGFKNNQLTFSIEDINHTNLTISATDNESSFMQSTDNEFEAYLLNGTSIDCEGIFTESNVVNQNIYLEFSSDGYDVEE